MARHNRKTGDERRITIAGVAFVIDPMGFVRSAEGELGHLEECREIAEFFGAFLDAHDAGETPGSQAGEGPKL